MQWICLSWSLLSVMVFGSGLGDGIDDKNDNDVVEDIAGKIKATLLPPLSAESPYPRLLHERDVIRHTNLRQQFLRVGKGAHGRISLGEFRGEASNQFIVVKTFRRHGFSQIMEEARIHRYLEGLNITPRLIGLLPSGPLSSNISLVYEFIPYSHSLYSWMKPERRAVLSTSQWLDVGLQVVRALGLVHSYDVIFNDLHRSNVVIQKRGDNFKVFIIDFGLATYKTGKRFGEEKYGSLKAYTYIAPEVKYLRMSSKMSDVHSIGIMFRKMSDQLGIPKLLPLAKWCSSFNPDDRPSLEALERKLMDMLLDQWMISLSNTWPNSPDAKVLSVDAFTGKRKREQLCEIEEVGGKYRNEFETDGVHARQFGELPVWRWLTENNRHVFGRCPVDIFVLDYQEVMLEEHYEEIHNSWTHKFLLTKLNSTNQTVIVKQFNGSNVDFSTIRQEVCVMAILGKCDVTPHVFGILPGQGHSDLNDASIVQDRFGVGVTLANYVERVRRTHPWSRKRLKRAAIDIDFKLANANTSSTNLNKCRRFSHVNEFREILTLIEMSKDMCIRYIESPKQKLFKRLATDLTKHLMNIHKNGYLVNSLNQYDVLVAWNDSFHSLNVKVIDLSHVTSINGVKLSGGKSLLKQFPFLAPEVTRGHRTSKRSDVYSLCVILDWLLVEFISDNDRRLRSLKGSLINDKTYRCDNELNKNIEKENGTTRHSMMSSENVIHNKSHCNKGEKEYYSELLEWSKLNMLLSNCLRNSADSRPLLQDIMKVLVQ